MSRDIKASSQFKRDIKRYKNDPSAIADISSVVSALSADIPLDPSYCDHPLKGAWLGCRDCHVRPDLILVYSKTDTSSVSVLFLYRVGSHAHVFY